MRPCPTTTDQLPHWETTPADLKAATREIKAAIRARIEASGRTVEEVWAVVTATLTEQVEEIEAAKAAGERLAGASTTPTSPPARVTAEQLAYLKRRGCLVVRGHFPREQALAWDQDIVDYVERNEFFEHYRGPGDDFFGSVGSKPEIFPVYWSPAQMQARQSDRMANVQSFLNHLWTNESDGVQWFDPDRDSLYPDRIRRRPPGASSGGLGAHLDPGTLDLWMTEAYQQAFRHLFDGSIEHYDPWDASHRTAGPAVPRHDDVLGLPHLPGLDGAVRHGPRPGRAAHRADPRGDGLPDAAPAAGRRGRRRHVRHHRQPGLPGDRAVAPAAHARRWSASRTSRPATPSGGTAT